MAIDLETVGHNWSDADGETPNGRVTFVLNLSTEAASEDTSISTRPIIAPLLSGVIAQPLVPNVNDDLEPDGSYYVVTEDIVGATVQQYPITVPTGGPFDLYALKAAS